MVSVSSFEGVFCKSGVCFRSVTVITFDYIYIYIYIYTENVIDDTIISCARPAVLGARYLRNSAI